MKSSTVLAIALASAPLLTGCAVFDRLRADSPAEAVALPGQVEAIHAAAIADDQAVFWVSSNGCTRKADLTPVVRPARDGAVITLRRLKEDSCGEPLPQEINVHSGLRLGTEAPPAYRACVAALPTIDVRLQSGAAPPGTSGV